MGQMAAPLQAAGAVVSSIGQLASGGGQAAAYQYNSMVDKQQAAQAIQQSFIKAAEQERAATAAGGTAQAGLAAGGVSPTSGSSLYVMNDIAAQGEMAKQLELYQGRVQATGYQRQSDVEHAQATAARTASYIAAAGTLLSGAGGAAGAQYKPPGGGGPSSVFVTPDIYGRY